MTEVAEHLGGYLPGGDPATYFPDLWRWLVTDLEVRTVLDVGCGEGWSLKYFRDELDCVTIGVDGVEQDDPDIHTHDFTTGPWPMNALRPGDFDLVWCCEFVEHVEERYAANFVSALQAGKMVLMTHAFPGQLGQHHVNCQQPDYWRGLMAGAGFVCDEYTTHITRAISQANTSPWNHWARSGLVFKREVS